MSDEHFTLSRSATPPPTEADYDAIFAAVMETVRGRWFLGEYAKRNRNADTEIILAAIGRVETAWRERRETSPAERLRFDLIEMAKAIAQTRSEIAAIKPGGDAKGSLSEATEELDSVVHTTERATSDILAAAEQVQEIAWTLRERGADAEACDALDRRATDIYTACSFQDLTGQRTRKVVEVLRFLEESIKAMIGIWGDAAPAQPSAVDAAAHAPHIGNGEAAEHLDQPGIDRMMPPRAASVPPAVETAALAQAVLGQEVAGDEAAGHDLDAAPIEPSDNARHDAIVRDASADGGAVHDGDTAPAEIPPPEPPPAPMMTSAVAMMGASAMAQEQAQIEMRQAAIAIMREPDAEPEPTHEAAPAPEPEPEPAPGEAQADPATLLNRILAMIRVPADRPSAGEPEEPGPPAAPQRDPASLLAALVTPLMPAPEAAPARESAVETPVAMTRVETVAPVAAAEQSAPAAQTAEASPTIDDDFFDDILLPLPSPVSVDDAVDEMLLKVPVRVDVATPAYPVATASATAEVSAATQRAEQQPAPRPFVIDVPELTVLPEPQAEPAPMAALPEEPTQADLPAHQAGAAEPEQILVEASTSPDAIAQPSPVDLIAPSSAPDVEPPAPAAHFVAAPEPAAVAAPELAPELEPLAAQTTPPPAIAPVPAPVAAPAAPPVRIAASRTVTPPPLAPVPRNEALAAITALSDEDKIALFS
jgi:hypothetical protein